MASGFAIDLLAPGGDTQRDDNGDGSLSADEMGEGPLEERFAVIDTDNDGAISQAEAFRDIAGVTGLIMTKLDGTARGGILVAIAAKHRMPVHAIGVGEGVDDLQAFDPKEFARAIASS